MGTAHEPKYPKGETVWAGYYDKDKNLRYIVTSKPSRDFYFLYENENGVFKKLGRAKSPAELETKFKVNKIFGK